MRKTKEFSNHRLGSSKTFWMNPSAELTMSQLLSILSWKHYKFETSINNTKYGNETSLVSWILRRSEQLDLNFLDSMPSILSCTIAWERVEWRTNQVKKNAKKQLHFLSFSSPGHNCKGTISRDNNTRRKYILKINYIIHLYCLLKRVQSPIPLSLSKL